MALQEQPPSARVRSHLIQVFDLGLIDVPLPDKPPQQRAFLSMQLIPGRQTVVNSVGRHSRHGMPVELSLLFLKQLLIPLAWMHRLPDPVIHGDLKPDNILLTDDKQIVLTDFGLAARLSEGARGGAIAYQAPETLEGLSGTPASDVYAVGLIWYEMLTGKSPFANVGLEAHARGDYAAFVEAHHQARQQLFQTEHKSPSAPQLVSELNPDLRQHPQLESILQVCLAESPDARWSDAQELLSQLDRYGNTVPTAEARVEHALPKLEVAKSSLPPENRLIADAEALLGLGRLNEALDRFFEVTRVDPNCLKAWCGAGRTALRLKKRDVAKQAYMAARQLESNAVLTQLLLAEIFDFDGKDALAVAIRARIECPRPNQEAMIKPQH